jgi:predicted phage tail protein
MFADVLAGVARLVQGELDLARAEAAERLRSVQKSAVQGAVALVLGITAINVLAAAAVGGVVALGLSPIWASLAVGGVLLLLALGFAQHAARLMRDAGTLPRRSGASIKRDVETLKSAVRSDGQA